MNEPKVIQAPFAGSGVADMRVGFSHRGGGRGAMAAELTAKEDQLPPARLGAALRAALVIALVLSIVGAASFVNVRPARAIVPRILICTSTVWTVESLADGPANAADCPGSGCTLRDAIAAAGNCNIIQFGVTGTILLSSGHYLISGETLTIQGPGANLLTLNAQGASRLFLIENAVVNMSGLTLLNGLVNSTNYLSNFVGGAIDSETNSRVTLDHMELLNNAAKDCGFLCGLGGGIYSGTGTSLTITDSFLNNNQALDGGGGVEFDSLAGGQLIVANSAFYNNNGSLGFGGGLEAVSGTASVYNSTFNSNSASEGGGIAVDGGANALLGNNTISGNTSNSGVGGAFAATSSGVVAVNNTIMANSTAGSDCSTSIAWFGHAGNLIQTNDGTAPCPTPAVSADPMLIGLTDNGGPTDTMALLPGSPAIDAADPTACADASTVNNLDQRGRPRNADGDHDGSDPSLCDIGAYEVPTFADLPVTGKEWMEAWVNAFYNHGVTTGCGVSPVVYCPENNVTREEMAVFLLRAIHGGGYTPPNVLGIFADMPVTGKEWMEPWVDEFYAEGITTGCGVSPLIFCPTNNVTREEMAVFILRAVHGCSYTPPNVTGIFADMPVTGKEWMEPWVDEFYNEGITTGCAVSPLRYCPTNDVTRAEMAVFIDRAFHLYP